MNVRTQTLHLKCARYDANIKGVDASEFPIVQTFATPGLEHHASLEADTFKEMVEQTTFAAATDDSRPVLTGVLAHFDKNTIRFAAADGFRLSVRCAHLEKSSKGHAVIVPARALEEVKRVLGDQEEPVAMAFTGSQMLFHLVNTDVVSQLIDGNFPPYGEILPKSHATRTVMNTSELQNAVRSAAVFARDASNIVRLEVRPSENGAKVVVAATSAETGDGVGEIDAQVEGEPIEIAFNARFMLDLLNALHAPQVVMETTTAGSPGLFKPVGSEGFEHVLMPMHI